MKLMGKIKKLGILLYEYYNKENWTSYTKLYLNIYIVSKLMQEIKKTTVNKPVQSYNSSSKHFLKIFMFN